ncbi:ABC transporter ATP-binding protein [Thermodesulfobacteriota bacterium]
MLTVVDIHTFYGKSYVLQGVSLTVGSGEIVAVLGRNGVGKTTLMRSVMGLTPAHRGRVDLHCEDVTAMPPYKRARRGLGLIPQGRQIFPSLSVLENLRIGARANSSDETTAWTLERILDRFPSLEPRLSNKGDQLSGGEQQMLAIGRALMGNPTFLLMDEPSEGLAPLIVRQIALLVGELVGLGLSILLVEQNFNFAMNSADYVYLMNKGRIVYESTPAELAARKDVRKRFLGI